MNDLIPNVTITGKVTFKGQDIYAPQTDMVNLRKQIGMVFQQPNPFPFSIYDNVAFGVKIAGKTSKEEMDRSDCRNEFAGSSGLGRGQGPPA